VGSFGDEQVFEVEMWLTAGNDLVEPYGVSGF